MSTSQRQPCTTCSRPWSADEFYASCAECKECKRERSRRNRAQQARKVAVAERLVDLLALLTVHANAVPADRGGRDEVAI